MIKIFLGSRNKAKHFFYHKYCSLIDCEFLTPDDLDEHPKFEENGETIKENAEIKAINWSRHTPDVVLAEDCGFDIPALDNWEKVSSKRNLGENLNDDDRRKKLLELMKNLKGEDRKVLWTVAIALAKEGKLLGSVSFDNPHPSYILEKIDPKVKVIPGEFLSCIEFKPEFGKVYTELTDEEIEKNEKEMFETFRNFIKNKISLIESN